jgi:hypothetical protein
MLWGHEMAKHRARKKRLRWITVAALAAAVTAIAAVSVALLGDPETPTPSAEPTDEVVVKVCTTLHVVTARSFEPVLRALEPHLAERRDCVGLDIEIADGQEAEELAVEAEADVWIPDDASWAGVATTVELDSEAEASGTVVASSPIFMVTDQATADRLNQAGGGWRDLADLLTADADARLVVRDPAGSGDGLVAIGAMGEAVWLEAGMDASAEALMTTFPSTRTVSDFALPEEAGEIGLVPEYALKEVLAAEGQSAAAIRSAALLAGADYSAVLRYTWLPTASGTRERRTVLAMEQLLDALTGDDAAAALAAAGLRDPDGNPRDQANLFPTLDAPPLDVLGPHQVDHVFATWYPEERTSDVLLVIDVSGSMAAPAAGSDTPLIELVRDGMLALAELLPDDSGLSLWQFGAQLDPPRDYVELLPRSQLGAEHRAALKDAAESMVATGTGTGLYDTTLAAYINARDNYRDGIPSHAVVFTDGRNEDRPGSITIEKLADELSDATDAARPVQLTIITFGDDTDAELLDSVLDESGAYIAHITRAQDVHAVFIHQAAGGRH